MIVDARTKSVCRQEGNLFLFAADTLIFPCAKTQLEPLKKLGFSDPVLLNSGV